ncbi:MAG: anhydro-N-acetylmuramic acid kinase, partial [Alphaproteobacteria bacterium]|nr:anhydro-N-acetylmuramic acid kinase [Alphaproteobacteria bacterium]
MRTIGLMSGTSLDGVDAAWLETDGVRIGRFGPRLTLPYSDGFRAELRMICDLAPALTSTDARLAGAVARITDHHARAVASLGEAADLIGFHGQTILHRPAERRTWQIGDATRLASITGTRTVYNFRVADVAAGGEGAPLAPVFHRALAATLAKPLAVLNIGGVANLTWLARSGEMVAFDTGPGNGLLDDWIKRRTGAPIDRDG